MRDKESRRIAVKVYDDYVGRSFVYYDNEIKNLGEKMPDLQRFKKYNTLPSLKRHSLIFWNNYIHICLKCEIEPTKNKKDKNYHLIFILFIFCLKSYAISY